MSTYKITQNLKLKVYDRLFVAFKPKRKESEGDFLAYLTPSDDSSASKKREDSARSWAKFIRNDRSGHVFRDEEYLTNEPLEGFAITDSLKRVYWGGGNVVWRVRDPRGFELEIQSQCLMSILASCTLKEGVIQGKCVWARDGSNNILLPEASMEYSTLIKKEVKGKKYVSPSKLVKSVKYLVGAGEDEHEYCGKYRLVKWDIAEVKTGTEAKGRIRISTNFGDIYTDVVESRVEFKDEDKVLHVFRRRSSNGVFSYVAYGSPKCLPSDSCYDVEQETIPRIIDKDLFYLASGWAQNRSSLVSVDVPSWKLDWVPSKLLGNYFGGLNRNVFGGYYGEVGVSFEGDSTKYTKFFRVPITQDKFRYTYFPVLSEVSFDGSCLKSYEENTEWLGGGSGFLQGGLKTKNLAELDSSINWKDSSDYHGWYCHEYRKNILEMEEKGLLKVWELKIVEVSDES